jgi:predicted nucleic acid-binding protein
MTLVDTSVWINHLRRADERLRRLLADGQVVSHPFVVAELACCGRFAHRDEVLRLLERLPALEPVSNREARAFLDAHRLAGSGIGWVDVHLLAAARLARIHILTADQALARAAARAGGRA